MQEKKSTQHSGLKCEKCGKDVTDKVANYSKQFHNKVLCMEYVINDGRIIKTIDGRRINNEQN